MIKSYLQFQWSKFLIILIILKLALSIFRSLGDSSDESFNKFPDLNLSSFNFNEQSVEFLLSFQKTKQNKVFINFNLNIYNNILIPLKLKLPKTNKKAPFLRLCKRKRNGKIPPCFPRILDTSVVGFLINKLRLGVLYLFFLIYNK